MSNEREREREIINKQTKKVRKKKVRKRKRKIKVITFVFCKMWRGKKWSGEITFLLFTKPNSDTKFVLKS